MHRGLDVATRAPEREPDADYLDGAGGRAGAAADKHRGEQRQEREGGPRREVLRCVAGRSHHRDHLERALPEGAQPAVVGGYDERRADQQREHCHDRDVDAELPVARGGSKVAAHGAVPEREVGARDDHEHCDDQL